MGLTVADTYYLKAKGTLNNFCPDWNEACESLNYALSYDENHLASLRLLGEIYIKEFENYEDGFTCFDKIIGLDTHYVSVYPIYGKYLIWADEIERAQKLIAFAFTIKKVDKGELYWLKAYIKETKRNYKEALVFLKEAKLISYDSDYLDFLKEEEKRIKKKIKLIKIKEKKTTLRQIQGKKTKKDTETSSVQVEKK